MRNLMVRALSPAVVALGLLLAACQPSVDPISLVNSLRVLTVRADPPEVGPAGTVRLTPLTVDPAGEGRTLRHAWRACDPRVPVYDPTLDCPEETSFPLPAPADGDGSEAELVLPDLLAHLGGGVDLAELQAELAMVTGASSRLGLSLQVLYTVSADLTEAERAEGKETAGVVALKRVTLSQSPLPNRNPSISGLRFDDEDWRDGMDVTFSKERELEIGAWLDPASFEVYQAVTPDGEEQDKAEELSLTWFVTQGKVGGREREYADPEELPPADEPYKSQTTKFTMPVERPSVESTTFWLVLLDGRGGVDWRSVRLRWR